MRRSMLTAIVPIVALLAAACGSSGGSTSTHATSSAPSSSYGSTSTSTSSSSSASTSKVTITAKTIKPYGAVLVAPNGHTLYIFAPDKAKKVTCTSACATIWPPLKVPPGAKPSGAGAVKGSLLGSDPNPGGGRVATYNGWPLYTYVPDSAPGMAKGEGVNSGGGLWYVISPSGKVIKPSH